MEGVAEALEFISERPVEYVLEDKREEALVIAELVSG